MQNQQAAATGGAYTYSQQPQGLPPKRATYRPDDQDISVQPSNIMWDRRVFRGNTYASQVMPPVGVLRALRLPGLDQAARAHPPPARIPPAARYPRVLLLKQSALPQSVKLGVASVLLPVARLRRLLHGQSRLRPWTAELTLMSKQKCTWKC